MGRKSIRRRRSERKMDVEDLGLSVNERSPNERVYH